MTYSRRIICLANSRKLRGRCIAGKELGPSGFGKWVRPVTTPDGGELTLTHITCRDGQLPNLLDVLKIPFTESAPYSYQSENRLIDDSNQWTRVGKIEISDLPSLCDRVNRLWVNGYNSASGANDRIPLDIAKRKVKSSLLLIKPDRLTISVVQERRRKVRARFFFHGAEYRLAVTDPYIEERFLAKENGTYPIRSRNVYLCISLGEPYKGFTYKLVAAIINLPQD